MLRTCCLVIVVSSIVATSCNTANQEQAKQASPASGGYIAEIAEYDFSAALENVDFYSYGDQGPGLSSEVNNSIRLLNGQVDAYGDSGLLEGDARKLISVWSFPDGSGYGYNMLESQLIRHAKAYGGFPETPEELLTRLDWDSQEGLQEFTQASETTKLQLMKTCVNPVTGRFFESYTSQQWRPYGVAVRLLAPEEYGSVGMEPASFASPAIEDGEVDYSSPEYQAEGVVEFTYFGAEPGAVLLQHYDYF